MSVPDRQFLVCLNTRPAGNPKGSCGEKGAQQVFDALKSMVKERGAGKRVMVNSTSCLKHCSRGVTVAVQPDNLFYAGVTVADVPELCDAHLGESRAIERLQMPDIPWE